MELGSLLSEEAWRLDIDADAPTDDARRLHLNLQGQQLPRALLRSILRKGGHLSRHVQFTRGQAADLARLIRCRKFSGGVAASLLSGSASMILGTLLWKLTRAAEPRRRAPTLTSSQAVEAYQRQRVGRAYRKTLTTGTPLERAAAELHVDERTVRRALKRAAPRIDAVPQTPQLLSDAVLMLSSR
jgi:hypothetical protein